jgi:hypothetical protein
MKANLSYHLGKWWPDLETVLMDLPEASEEPARVPGIDQRWPWRKTLESLASSLAKLSSAQQRVVHEIFTAAGILNAPSTNFSEITRGLDGGGFFLERGIYR